MPTCTTCPHACNLQPGQLGLCRSRRASADGSSVEPEGYGRLTSLALDPIEKKPIARWRPGTTVLSLGSYGCNMRCPFCQNSSIAQVDADAVHWEIVEPETLVQQALTLADRRCIGIAYTYNEPLVNWEFLRDTATLAHENGLMNVLVSNGMATDAVLDEVLPLIDAANIDLKCFTAEGYRQLGGNLAAVQRTIARCAALPSCHLEVTTLVVPGVSDDLAQIDEMAAWIASLPDSADTPYHLTRYFPSFHYREPATPLATMRAAAAVARTHLNDVLLGNM